MVSIKLDELEAWLGCLPARATHAEVILVSDSDRPTPFRIAAKALAERFGEPDSPGGDFDWLSALRLHSPWAAVWDFDYYRLILVAESEEGRVVLTVRHD